MEGSGFCESVRKTQAPLATDDRDDHDNGDGDDHDNVDDDDDDGDDDNDDNDDVIQEHTLGLLFYYQLCCKTLQFYI